MHIWVGKFDIAQGGYFEFQGILGLLGNGSPSVIIERCINQQAIVFKLMIGEKWLTMAVSGKYC